MRASQKAPVVEYRDYADTIRGQTKSVLLKLANHRSSQELSMRQAENLAHKLLKLVQEHKVREVMES